MKELPKKWQINLKNLNPDQRVKVGKFNDDVETIAAWLNR